jgi:hypothetical protein
MRLLPWQEPTTEEARKLISKSMRYYVYGVNSSIASMQRALAIYNVKVPEQEEGETSTQYYWRLVDLMEKTLCYIATRCES